MISMYSNLQAVQSVTCQFTQGINVSLSFIVANNAPREVLLPSISAALSLSRLTLSLSEIGIIISTRA